MAGAAGVLVPALTAHANPPVPPPAGAIVAGTAGPDCPSPTYSTIQAAINGATAGATIYVCAGTYNESPTINKPLTLDGAQYDVDARTRAGSTETVVDGAGGITYTAGATSGTVNGFTIQGYAGTAGAIDAVGVGSGWRFVNDVIDVSTGAGVYFNTGGAANPATTGISTDVFTQATPSAATSGDDGQAVVVAGGTANNVSVQNDGFLNLSGPGAAVDTTGGGACGPTLNYSQVSNNVVVANNLFSENGGSFTDPVNGPGFVDEAFLELACTAGAHVRDNTVTITDTADSHARSPIALAGGDWSTLVSGNILTGNGAANATGIDVSSDAFPPGTPMSVDSNHVSGFRYGIDVRSGALGHGYASPSGFAILSNEVTASTTDGIAVHAGSGGSIDDNGASGSAVDDCLDATTGSGTAGTANGWVGDGGGTSSPAGLCHAFTAPSLSVPGASNALVGSPFSVTLTAGGYPVPAITRTGTVPKGLSFVDNGNGTATISGVPQASGAGPHLIRIHATNLARITNNTASATLTLLVNETPAFTTRATRQAVPGTRFSFVMKARGYPPPTLSESGPLPAGVTFSYRGKGEAVLSGRTTGPIAATTWPLTITAANAVSTATQQFTLVTNKAARFTGPRTTTATVGVPFSYLIGTSPSVSSTLTESGALPPGITFTDHGNGTASLSGTPGPGSNPTYMLTLLDRNGALASTRAFVLRVNTPPSFTSATNATVPVNAPVTFLFTTTGYPHPKITESGALPRGVVFSSTARRTEITGVPATPGTYLFTVTAANVAGRVAQPFTLVVQ
jgi:hypothetical protein